MAKMKMSPDKTLKKSARKANRDVGKTGFLGLGNLRGEPKVKNSIIKESEKKFIKSKFEKKGPLHKGSEKKFIKSKFEKKGPLPKKNK